MKKIILPFLMIISLHTLVLAQFSEDKFYHIVNNNTEMYLSVSKDSIRSGQFLVQAHKDSLKSTKWSLIPNKDGTYYLLNEYTKKYAFVYKGTMKEGALVVQASQPRHRSFAWKIIRENSESERFKIRNANSNRPVGPYNGKLFSGVNIIQDEDRNQKHHFWTIVEAN